jgi:hypothetical protein
VIAGHDHSSNKRSVFCISCLDATVMSNRSTLQPPNPDRASDRPIGTNPSRVRNWPIGTNPNRAREQPMRTGPVAQLSGVQVTEGKCDMVVNRKGGGPISHATLFWTPPPLKAKWQGGSGIHLSIVDHGELISTVRELHLRFRSPPPPHR